MERLPSGYFASWLLPSSRFGKKNLIVEFGAKESTALGGTVLRLGAKLKDVPRKGGGRVVSMPDCPTCAESRGMGIGFVQKSTFLFLISFFRQLFYVAVLWDTAGVLDRGRKEKGKKKGTKEASLA